jgi:alpha-L-fucosidase
MIMILTRFVLLLLIVVACPAINIFSQHVLSDREIALRLEDEKTRDMRIPENDFSYRMVKDYIEVKPDADYFHASREAFEKFKDMKYGIRIHWGVYGIPKYERVSWDFLYSSDEDRQQYQQLYKSFNPVDFDSEQWMSFFKKSGFNCLAFTAKHHDGFSMFDTKTRVRRRVNYRSPNKPDIEECDLAYSIMETPFKRDIVKELCESARKHGLRIDLYFSHPDWYDADFRPYAYHPLQTPQSKNNVEKTFLEYYPKTIMPPADTAAVKRMVMRHRTQVKELLTNYGKIDMICFDQWFDSTLWPELKQTIKMARSLQPDVMFRGRGIGNYGDYFTPEAFVPEDKEHTDMAWMVIYPLGINFGYDNNAERYKGSKWIIHNLIDAVSKGGNFMVGVGPDGTGKFHPKAIEQIEEAGRWLKVNGEAIYATRSREHYREGDDIRYTISKDSSTVYAFSLKWPGKEMTLSTVTPLKNMSIHLLGHEKPLRWRYRNKRLIILMPHELQDEKNRSTQHAWSFRITNVKA